jgi:hypothetical protein
VQTDAGDKHFIGALEVHAQLAQHPVSPDKARHKGCLVACNACYQVCTTGLVLQHFFQASC